jgi:hypothetical protein
MFESQSFFTSNSQPYQKFQSSGITKEFHVQLNSLFQKIQANIKITFLLIFLEIPQIFHSPVFIGGL